MQGKAIMRGYASVVAAAFLWSFSGTAAKFLFGQGVSPFQLVQLRTTIAAAVLICSLLLLRPKLLKLDGKDVPYFLLVGAILSAVQFTYLFSISKIPVAAAILIQYLSPVMIALHARVFRKKRLSPFAMLAIAGAVAGCYLMAGAYNVALFALNRTGVLAGLASAAAFAWYAIKSEDGLKTYSPWTLLAYALFVAAVIWNVLQPPLRAFAGGYSPVSWCLVLFIAFFGTVLPFGLYNIGIRSIQATHASITSTLEPVFAGLIAYLFLHEIMEGPQIVGAGVVIASILFLQFSRSSKA